MPRSGPFQLLSFRRSFSLLLLLIALPSAAITGFGVLAIINERAAVEKRLAAAWTGKLDQLAARLEKAFDATELRARPDGLSVRVADGPELSFAHFQVADGRVDTGDTRLAQTLRSVLAQLRKLEGGPTFFSVAGPHGTFLLAAERQGTVVRGAALDPTQVDALLARLGKDFLQPGVSFVLRPVQKEPQGLIGKLVSGVSVAKGSARGPPPLAEVSLPPPLQDFHLQAVPIGRDPVAHASTRNRVIYSVLLALFYATLVVGVVYTARVLYREAKLSRMKTDFVSLVSHELRTPLTSIRMFIETLSLGRVKDPEQTQQVLALLAKETERLSQMIEGVLDWARLESGRKRYNLETVEVRNLVEPALAAFRAQHLDATALSCRYDEALPTLRVDREAIAGALLNLLQNAFKYGGEEKWIAVRALKSAKGVAIEVEDRGMGIAPKDRKRIFDRFFRVDNLLTRSTEGSGLGLAISKRIVEAHGGELTVASELGKGSTFTVRLPGCAEARGV